MSSSTHAHGAVHGRVRRAHVEEHRLGRQLELGFVELVVERLHQFTLVESSVVAPRLESCVWRPKDMPSSAPNGASFLDVRHVAVGDERLGLVGRVVLAQRVPLELRVHAGCGAGRGGP